MGIPPPFPYNSEQSIGGWMAIFVIALLVTRKHIAKVARTILGMPGGIDDSQEPIRYRHSNSLDCPLQVYLLSGFV